MDNSFYHICHKFLAVNKICVDSERMKKELYSHAAYPSLKSLTDVLSDLKIEYRALRINTEQLQEYGTPVLLHYQGRKPQFVVATHISNQKITFYKDNQQKEVQSLSDFSKYWNGAALYVFEPEKQSVTCRLTEAFIKERGYLLALLTVILILPVLCMFVTDGWFYGLLFLKLVGLFFSVLLLRHDLGKRSKTERHICGLSKKVSCDAVLSSAASKLFGLIKMSDIGMVYFSGGFLCLVFSLLLGQAKAVWSVLGILSICSFPYLLFSLGYQKFEVKKWCPLCLGVVSVLLLEIGMVLIKIYEGYSIPDFALFVIVGTFFMWLALVWERLSNYMKSAIQSDENEIRFLTLKRNFSIFSMMLDRQPALNMMFSQHDVSLGNPEAPFIITIAINPFCSPCLDLYNKLFDLLQKRSEVFRLNIRFMSMDEEKRNEQIGLALIHLYLEDKERFVEAFDFWRKDKNFLSFAAQYKVSDFSSFARQVLDEHLSWRKKLDINHTPIIFVNNKRLPDMYTESDLLYFLQHNE